MKREIEQAMYID